MQEFIMLHIKSHPGMSTLLIYIFLLPHNSHWVFKITVYSLSFHDYSSMSTPLLKSSYLRQSSQPSSSPLPYLFHLLWNLRIWGNRANPQALLCHIPSTCNTLPSTKVRCMAGRGGGSRASFHFPSLKLSGFTGTNVCTSVGPVIQSSRPLPPHS